MYLVTVATTSQARPLLTDRTLFWVVKPRLFAGDVSGLETVLSGWYSACCLLRRLANRKRNSLA